MFGISWAELVVVGLVVLVVVGPEKLPEAARALGKAYGYVHRTLMEARASLKAETDLLELEARNERKPAEPGESAEDEPRPIPPKDGA